ncbi:hypothetical protein QCA50_017237 [Cerrena zonata]|uniref:Importin N-terminal domain-containing protein n=1 Tax=Cerrena zonata TaxID=2478898 RepID=A0AAW0FG54_9APHY
MDAQFLLQCFSATLQADQSVRTQAEAELRRLVITPGFLGGCLDIIASTGEGIDPAIRKAAAVFFKNRVIKNWSQNSPNKIDEDEKPVIKDRILPVLVASDYNTKQQLIPVLRVLEREMLNNFFRRWFTLIPMLKRVFDLKLSIMGLISLISDPNAFNSLDQSIVEHLGTSLVALFSELPNALESFAKKRQTFSYTDFSSSQDYYQNWDDEDELSAEAVSEYLASEDSVDKDENSTQAYMNFLLEENSKLKNSGFYDEDEEQIVEDPLVTTPLDNIDAFQIFREFGGSLQANNPKTYTLVFGTLNDSQQNINGKSGEGLDSAK